jgi:small GTP-binding protein
MWPTGNRGVKKKEQNGTIEFPFLSKVAIIGNSFVGKSSLLFSFTDDGFQENFITTIGVDFRVKQFAIDNKVIDLQFFDTAGQERFASITSSYYRGVSAVLLVYDVTSVESFDCIKNWTRDIDRCCQDEKVVKFLIGNKCDCDQKSKQVSKEMGQLMADELDARFIETSAKSGLNVDKMFTLLAQDLLLKSRYQKEQEKEKDEEDKNIEISKESTNFYFSCSSC